MPNAPLIWNIPIVDKDGRPTPAFLRAWQKARGILNSAEALETPGGAGTFLEGSTPPSWSTITEGKLTLSDNTVNNATSLRHGFLPKLDGAPTHFLAGDGTWQTPAGGTGGLAVKVRSTTIYAPATGSASFVVTLPAGATAGDHCYLFTSHGWTPSSAVSNSTWNVIYQNGGTNWSMGIFDVVLTAADITLGTVTVTYSGSYNGVVGIFCLEGNVSAYIDFAQFHSGTGVASDTLALPATTEIADLALLFSSNRATSSVDTISQGTQVEQIGSTNSSGVMNEFTVDNLTTPIAAQYSVSGSGHSIGIVVIRPAIEDKQIAFTDNVVGDAATTQHGYLPKLSGNATDYLDGTGAWSVPAGGGGGGGGGGGTGGSAVVFGFQSYNDSNSNTVAPTMLLRRMYLPGGIALADLACPVNAAGTGQLTAVIYDDVGGLPTNLLATGSTIAGVVVGENISTFSGGYTVPSSGIYWVGVVQTTATVSWKAAVNTMPIFFQNGITTPPNPMTGTFTSTSQAYGGFYLRGTYGLGLLSSEAELLTTPREYVRTGTATFASGFLSLHSASYLPAGLIVTGVKTVASAPVVTNWTPAIYDLNYATGQCNTLQTSGPAIPSIIAGINIMPLTTPWVVPTSGFYFYGQLNVGATCTVPAGSIGNRGFIGAATLPPGPFALSYSGAGLATWLY